VEVLVCHQAAYVLHLFVRVAVWQCCQYVDAEQGYALRLCGIIVEPFQPHHGVRVLRHTPRQQYLDQLLIDSKFRMWLCRKQAVHMPRFSLDDCAAAGDNSSAVLYSRVGHSHLAGQDVTAIELMCMHETHSNPPATHAHVISV
jgi:hypothetical protein